MDQSRHVEALLSAAVARSATVLDLSNLGLRVLPNSVVRLSGLTAIWLDGNNFEELPEALLELPNLRSVSLKQNHLQWMSPSISRLESLRSLLLPENDLVELPDNIGQMRHLSALVLRNNRLSTLPRTIGNLHSLENLDLSHNALSELPSNIGNLTRLKEMYVDHNRLRVLPTRFGDLQRLETLDLSANELTQLPNSLGEITTLKSLSLGQNPLPVEVQQVMRKQGSEGLRTWLKDQATGVEMREAKVLVLGEGGVGKTSLVARLSGLGFVERPRTHGIEIGATNLGTARGTDLVLRFWDFGGQEHYRATHQFFFTPDTVYVVVWNGRLNTTQGRVASHLESIRLRVPGSPPILLVATHTGPSDRADYDLDRLQRASGGAIRAVIEVDNATGFGIDRVLEAIVDCASDLEHMNRRWSDAAAALRDELTAIAERQPQLMWRDFIELGEEYGLDEAAAEQVAIRLSVMGRITYFGDRATLSGRLILQPEFLTSAIADVLDHKPTKDAGGVIRHEDLQTLWTKPPQVEGDEGARRRFRRDDFGFLVELMQLHGVSFQLADQRSSLIGQLVPENPPAPLGLPPVRDSRRSVRRLVVKLNTAAELPGLVAGLIVRNHPYRTGKWWRHGVVLQHPVTLAVGLILLVDDTTLTLTVWNDGPDSFFYRLRASIESVLAQWPDLEPSYAVACPTNLDSAEGDPATWFCSYSWDFRHLVRFRAEGDTAVRCGECGTIYTIAELLGELDGAATSDGVLSEVLGRLNDVLHSQKDLQSGQDQLRDLVEHGVEGSAVLMSAIISYVTTEVADVPRLVSISPVDRSIFNPSNWASQAYRLHFWCEYMDAPHPTTPSYQFNASRDWYRRAGPYLRAVSIALKLTPIVRGVVGVAGDQLAPGGSAALTLDEIKDSVELTESVALAASEDFGFVDDESNLSTAGLSSAPELRHLRELVHSIGAYPELGGLRRTPFSPVVSDASRSVAPDGNFYWLCATHHRLVVQGPPLPPGDE